VEEQLAALSGDARIESYVADLSSMAEVEALANAVAETHTRLDVLINNAGVYRAPDTVTRDGLDIRFAVNTIAPYLLTQRLLPLVPPRKAIHAWSTQLDARSDDEGRRPREAR
jgi:NAD(P)-dependent dehydrogenase (short-subunit alcohol dehydrogenase family)